MSKTTNKTEKKKGIWALLKESIAKSNDGCGPGCGCHAEATPDPKEETAPPANTEKERKTDV